MTVVASCLFALAALAALMTIATAWAGYVPALRALRAQLRSCPEGTVLEWAIVERIRLVPLAPLRAASARRPLPDPSRRERPALEWPSPSLAA